MARIDADKLLRYTKEDIEELKQAAKRPIVFDEDCPEVTPDKARKFKRVNPPRDMAVNS